MHVHAHPTLMYTYIQRRKQMGKIAQGRTENCLQDEARLHVLSTGNVCGQQGEICSRRHVKL